MIACALCEAEIDRCMCIENVERVESMTLEQFEIRVRARSGEEFISNEVIAAMYEDRVIAAREAESAVAGPGGG